MDSSVITGLAALGGSLVGAFSSFATTYVTQRHQGARERIARDLDRREVLYGKFIDQAAVQFVDSLDKSLDNPSCLIELIAIVGRIRLTASQEVVDASNEVMKELLTYYERPAVNPSEFLIHTRENFTDPLAAFTLVCRREREQLLSVS